MSLDDQLRRVTQKRKLDDQASAARYREASRQRLSKILSKKLSTAFIGAIARFEEAFGHIWGHGKHANDCTAEQLKMRSLWERCRNEVLNNGNSQARAVESELALYDVKWNRYQTNLRGNNGER